MSIVRKSYMCRIWSDLYYCGDILLKVYRPKLHSNLRVDKIYHCTCYYQSCESSWRRGDEKEFVGEEMKGVRGCCTTDWYEEGTEFYQQTDLKFNLFYDSAMFPLIFVFCSFRRGQKPNEPFLFFILLKWHK